MPKQLKYKVVLYANDKDIQYMSFYSLSDADSWFRWFLRCMLDGELKTVCNLYLCVNDYIIKYYANPSRLREHLKLSFIN